MFTLALMGTAQAAQPNPTSVKFEARASEIDPRVKAHPEIGFLIEDAKGRPADIQHASVDPSVAPRGKLVIWLMGANQELFDRWNSYGLHVIRPHYANRWFSLCCRENPVGEQCRGNIRLEAATGQDFSDDVDIPKPDGMMERSLQFVKWLSKKHPAGNWEQFLNADGTDLNWENVIVSGSSHGSTTAARFAKHVKVSRVVALCGPRDQHQTWQSLPSATPANRYFGFSHVLDGGWTGDHYCRSWELLGMNQFGPIVNVDQADPPYSNTRRLITDFDVDGDANRAHSSIQPGRKAFKNAEDGTYMHEPVWKYLYTHPVDIVGEPTALDESCDKVQSQ
ncbi:BPSS1187 family protein [Stieleria tagensis]